MVAFLVLLCLPPGMTEVAETVVSLITERELPSHGVDDEHTCTPLAHHCGCHSTMSAQTTPPREFSLEATRDYTELDPSRDPTLSGRPCDPPLLRPPIG